jgi:hypothetical protein
MKIFVGCIAVIIFGVIIIQSFMPAAEYVVQGNTLTFKEFLLERGIKINEGNAKADNVYKKIIIRIGKFPKDWDKFEKDVSARWIVNGKDSSDNIYFLFLFPGPQPKK